MTANEHEQNTGGANLSQTEENHTGDTTAPQANMVPSPIELELTWTDPSTPVALEAIGSVLCAAMRHEEGNKYGELGRQVKQWQSDNLSPAIPLNE